VTPGTLPRIFRSLVPRAAVLAGSLTLAGCNSIREMTSGLTESTELPKNEGALNRFAEDWGQRYDRNPKDKKTAMTYANALRALGQHAQAVAVLQRLAARNPGSRGVGAYGNKQLPQAEETLRDAANNPKADMRIRQNLALVLALEGKFGEAENWSRRDLAPIDAAANVASIRKMIAQSNTWRDLQQFDRQAQRKDPAKNSTSVAATRPVKQEIPASLANAD